MSVKIYYGFKTNLSIDKLLGRVRKFRKEVWRPSAEKMLDRFVLSGGEQNKSKMWGQWLDRRAHVKRTLERDPAVDTEFQIILFPRKKSGFLGMVISERTDWYDDWVKQPGVVEYGYWDNADEPENMSRRAWTLRKKEWEHVLLNGSGIPAMEGLTINIDDPFGPAPEAWRTK